MDDEDSRVALPQSAGLLDALQPFQHFLVLPQLGFLLPVGLFPNVFFFLLQVLHAVAEFFGILQQLFFGLRPYGKTVLEAYAIDSIDQLILLFLWLVQ